MIRFRRRNTPWLVALGALIAIALISNVATADMQLVLLGLFAVAMVGSFLGLDIARGRSMLNSAQRAPARKHTSPQAKEALERAERRGGYLDPDMLLLDVGLITLQSGDEGMVMRRTRTISKDEDGVRPFVTLYIMPEESERNALIRFEMFDHTGQQQYVHEMKTYLREGEMNIIADHHLPLRGNRSVSGIGDWDLRLYIDNNLVGMHNFMLAPSFEERRQRLSPHQQQDEAEEVVMRVQREADIAPRLEDLLRSSRQQAVRPRTVRPSRSE